MLKEKLEKYDAGETVSTKIGDFIVLDKDEHSITMIPVCVWKEKMIFDPVTAHYEKSYLKEYIESRLLPVYEEAFENRLIEEEVEISSMDMRVCATIKTKIRPLTFHEIQKYYSILSLHDITDAYWTCTPWSVKEDQWKRSLAVVSGYGYFHIRECDKFLGIRPIIKVSLD